MIWRRLLAPEEMTLYVNARRAASLPIARTHSELCHIISGRAEMRTQDGTVHELTAGDLLVLPQGWRGEWILKEKTRKLYVIQQGDSDG